MEIFPGKKTSVFSVLQLADRDKRVWIQASYVFFLDLTAVHLYSTLRLNSSAFKATFLWSLNKKV